MSCVYMWVCTRANTFVWCVFLSLAKKCYLFCCLPPPLLCLILFNYLWRKNELCSSSSSNNSTPCRTGPRSVIVSIKKDTTISRSCYATDFCVPRKRDTRRNLHTNKTVDKTINSLCFICVDHLFFVRRHILRSASRVFFSTAKPI